MIMIFWCIVIGTIIIDQATKIWITYNFDLFQSTVIVPGFLNMTYVTNKGAAFSMLADVDSPWRHYFFVSVGGVALLILTVVWFKNRKGNQISNIALGLIVAGAAGNLIDRVRLGAVVDFIDVYLGSRHWPAFNVADSAICVGVVTYLLISYLEERKIRTKI